MKIRNVAKLPCLLAVLWAASAIDLPAQTFSSLASFSGGNGTGPTAGLTQGLDGNFYGTTLEPVFGGQGNVYRITADGTLTDLYNFCSLLACADGQGPESQLLLANNGLFYGTTFSGGTGLNGTVFQITEAGAEKAIYSFCATDCSDGANPVGGVVQAADGIYGTTQLGGNPGGPGTIFKISHGGNLTTLYTFCTQIHCRDGEEPVASLTYGKDGSLYGVAAFGGGNNSGTVFKISPAGVFTTLHRFVGSDGATPSGSLVQAPNGSFYGVANAGGNTSGTCSNGGCGTIFRISPSGAFATLHKFSDTDGRNPVGGLILGTDGNYYGTTSNGGANGYLAGTVFQITPSGQLTTLYNFCSQGGCADGNEPEGSLMQATNGVFYGTTAEGGSQGDGTVFSVSTGLAPFVKTLPAAGKAGTQVIVLGNGLAGTSSVTFGGIPASFSVASDTRITATVPTGATSGTVAVTTPGGTLQSNAVFLVSE